MNATENVYLLADSTVFGSAKDGMVLTNEGLYYKNLLAETGNIRFSDICDVSTQGNTLVIDSRISHGVVPHVIILTFKPLAIAKTIQDIMYILNSGGNDSVDNTKASECHNCNTPYNPDSKFCSSCGTSVPSEPQKPLEPEIKHCSKCNAVVAIGTRFCSECGSPIT